MVSAKLLPQVHVLGLGSIGIFAAHAIADLPEPACVTLLAHRPSLMDEYKRNDNQISLKTHQGESIARRGYAFEFLRDNKWYAWQQESQPLHKQEIDPIHELILCVKSTQTVTALRPLLHRLTPTSTIMFLQNGAGMMEDANQHLFRDPSTRPNYITGVISHGVTLNSPFNVTHTGAASTSIGLVPRNSAPRIGEATGELPQVESHLLRQLPLVSRLNCKSYGWPGILQLQLEKLAVNAISNPLCSLADKVTAYLFTIPDICQALISEISSVAIALPELRGVPGVAKRFSPGTLGSTVTDVFDQNRETTVSMVWDMRAHRGTEIRYINGYWSRRGRELGIPTPINHTCQRAS